MFLLNKYHYKSKQSHVFPADGVDILFEFAGQAEPVYKLDF